MADGELKRVLGPVSAYALIAGSMIGTGIFFFVSPVARQVPDTASILAVWTAGTLIASCGALCVAELAAAYPHTGGIYVFLREAFGPWVAFLYMWASFLILRIGSLSIMALAFATFLAELAGLSERAARASSQPLAIAAIVAVTVANIRGVRLGAGLQVVLTALKLAALVAIAAVALAFAGGLLDAHPVAIDAPPAPPPPSLLGFGIALVPVMWTLGGWDESPFVAEEVRDPERNLPLSVLAGLWSVGALFVLTNAAYLLILSPAELAASDTRTATLAMERALGPSSAGMLSLALAVSTLGGANGMTMTGARIAYAAARDNRLFTWLARLDARTGTPARALLVQAALACLTIVVLSDPYALLLYTAVAYWLFAALTALAVVALRRRDPLRPRPFRVWGYPLVPIAFIVAALAMAMAATLEDAAGALATVAILATGTIAYLLERLVSARTGRG